jgi:hypothetical protein
MFCRKSFEIAENRVHNINRQSKNVNKATIIVPIFLYSLLHFVVVVALPTIL